MGELKSRYLSAQIKKDLNEKMVFIAGPRQCGKTTLAKSFLKNTKGTYFNWDDLNDRPALLKHELPTGDKLIVLDEIHKYHKWRMLLKGWYDKHGTKTKILVTGSAKLDAYRKGGDSLQGRYHLLRMYPLSLKEVFKIIPNGYEHLFEYGGFPEPFFKGDQTFSRRWTREYQLRIINEEVNQLERITELSKLESLALRLPDLVGSPLSINALREDLEVAHQSVVRWLDIFEKLYQIFRIYPFGSPKIKALKKESKLYFFDWNLIEDSGARFENIIGFHLLKECHFLQDTQGFSRELMFFRDREQREVDFVVTEKDKPLLFVECKLSDKNVSSNLIYLKKKFPNTDAVQVLNKSGIDFINKENIRVVSAEKWLLERVC